MNRATLRKKTLNGVKWNTANQFVSNAFMILTSIVLMQFLTPKEFGVVGMITVITGFLSTFSSFGLGSSLIYKGKLKEIDKSTIFWTQVSLGILLTAILFFGADFIAEFYSNSSITNLVHWLAFLFIIDALGKTSQILMMKELDFKKIFVVAVTSALFGGAAGIIAAFNHWGVYSLVTQYLITAIVRTALMLLLGGYIIRLKFSYNILRGHLRYSLPLFGNNFINYWANNSDNLIIGKFLGESSLGLYSRAYTFMMIPSRRLTMSISGVLFPSLSKMKKDKKLLISSYLSFNILIALAMTPIMAMLIIIAKPFINIIGGQEWTGMIKTFQLLCVVGWLQAITITNSKIFMVLGLTSLILKLTILNSIIAISGFIIGVQFSIEAVAFSYLITSLISSVLSFRFVMIHLDLSIYHLLKGLIIYVFLFILITYLGINLMNRLYYNEIMNLAIGLLFSIIFFLTAIFLLRKQDLLKAYNATKEMLAISK